MLFRKFIGWILRWIDLQRQGIETTREGRVSYAELMKKTRELEELIQHMSSENEEIKTAFFRNIYHEIRTPMNSILGFSSLLHNENLTAEKRNIYTDQVWKSSAVFLQFIDDLVEASILETQKIMLEPVWFPVNDLLQELYQSCNRKRHLMDKNSVALLLDKTSFKENVHAETDRKRLFQMMEYYITDCISDMDKGLVELSGNPTLNGGLSFTIKCTPHARKDTVEDIELKRFGMGSKYGSQLRKRLAEKLITLFSGEVSLKTDDADITMVRVVINPVSLRKNNINETSKTDDKKIAI